MSTNAATVKAGVNRVGKFHPIWLVPIVAFVMGAWMVWAHWISQGPVIEISFESAEGIEAGKSKVRRKNVEIGEVLAMRLADDAERVLLSVQVHKENAELLREDSEFWVVRPRIGPGGVSGLSTLLSGAYIEMSPGTAEDTARHFEGLERPPATPIGTPGLRVTLDSDSNRALNIGAPVLFGGRPVGTIDYVHFNTTERRTYYDAFISAPYDGLITSNTQFWFSGGVSVELSADGVRVDFANVQSIIEGGVSFGVPEGQPLGERITERAYFTIHPRESAINERPYEHSIEYVLLFDDSIRGLRPGAPVEYRGVRIGRVLRTDINYDEPVDLLLPNSRIPVTIEIIPARLGYEDTLGDAQIVTGRLDELVENGLHGSLEIGSLITGQKYIELQYLDVEPMARETFAGRIVIPSMGNEVDRLLASATRAVDALGKLPLDDVVTSIGKALEQTADTLEGLDEILDTEAARQVFEKLNITLEGLQQLAADYSEGSKTNRELQQSLRALERSLVELEPVLRQLRRKPNSLVFGADESPDPEPRGVNE